jgi:hypothetical protein
MDSPGGTSKAALDDGESAGRRRPDVWISMSEGRGDYETIFCSNGWIEIRNQEETDDQWIATDRPVSIER